MLLSMVFPKKRTTVFRLFQERSWNFKIPISEPIQSDLTVEDVLLPEGDPALQSLIIKREDLSLIKQFPETRSNRPLRIGTVGKEGKVKGFTAQKGMLLHYLLLEEESEPEPGCI